MIQTRFLLITLIGGLIALVACTPASTPPTETPVAIVKILATAYISPTPNPEQAAATRSAITATPLPPTPTIDPTATAYIGVFIGEAEREVAYRSFTEPLFANAESDNAIPTADVARCSREIDGAYSQAWRDIAVVNQRLGCPIQQSFGFFGRVQVFEDGLMYTYPEINSVWAFVDIGTSLARYEYVENPTNASNDTLEAPLGLLLPDGIFEDMWLAVPQLSDDIGFARTGSQETALGLQRFTNGTFIHDVDAELVYALVADGTLLGPYPAAEFAGRPTLEAPPTTESTPDPNATPTLVGEQTDEEPNVEATPTLVNEQEDTSQ